MTNEEYIISQISERSLADMFNTGNVYYNNLNARIYKAFGIGKSRIGINVLTDSYFSYGLHSNITQKNGIQPDE